MKLETFLGLEQAALVQAAVDLKIMIIVDGDRSRATGKSTLCSYLKSKGAVACEAWELEEGSIQPNDNANSNTVSVNIRLDKALFT